MKTSCTVAFSLISVGVLGGALNFAAHQISDALPRSGIPRPLAFAAAADWAWLKANLAWEKQDADAVRGLSEVSVALTSNDSYFCANAARMRAFDFPAWRTLAEPQAPVALRQRWRREAGQEALLFLAVRDDGSAEHAIEAGAIALYALEDLTSAAQYFRAAAERPKAPWFAGRVHAELLHRAGRTREAVEWLRAWLPRLPEHDVTAQRALVERRLAELERELSGG